MESFGIPTQWAGPTAGVLFFFVLFSLARGWLLFKWHVEMMFKDKDALIAYQQKRIEEVVASRDEVLHQILTILEKQGEGAHNDQSP